MPRKPYVPTASDVARRARVYLDTPGRYSVTLARGGLEVAAEVRFGPTPDPHFPDNAQDRSWFWELWIDDGGLRCVEGPVPEITWTKSGRPISDEEFAWLLEDRAWARQWAPDSPEANPRRPADVNTVAIPEF